MSNLLNQMFIYQNQKPSKFFGLILATITTLLVLSLVGLLLKNVGENVGNPDLASFGMAFFLTMVFLLGFLTVLISIIAMIVIIREFYFQPSEPETPTSTSHQKDPENLLVIPLNQN